MSRNVLDKTLKEMAFFLKEAFIVDYMPDSFISRLNEPVKVISLIIFIIGISLMTNIYSLLLLYLFSILLAYLSKINLALFFRKVWIFIPIFTLVIAIPSLFIVPGRLEFGFTIEGLVVMVRLVLRVATSISYVTLVILTTRWTKLLFSLRYIGVPNVFVSIISMSYRYIFLLLETAENLFLAKKMRTIITDTRREQQWLGSTVGVLAIKTQQLSREVYQGMVSRGVNKNIRYLNSSKVYFSDILALGLTVILNIVILYIDRRLGWNM
ncbi:MAG: cobalt ECF transporter T component CbiQ [bacterium]